MGGVRPARRGDVVEGWRWAEEAVEGRLRWSEGGKAVEGWDVAWSSGAGRKDGI
jgi:hypothetical protein